MPNLRLREATSQDREALLALCDKRRYPDSAFMDKEPMRQTVNAHIEQFFEAREHAPNLRFQLLEEDKQLLGFLLLEVQDLESITKQSQTLICDYQAENEEQFRFLMEAAAQSASEHGDEYLVVSNYSRGGEEQEVWLERFGFHRELLRVVKVVGPDHEAPCHPDFRIRPATDNDMLFIMRLVAGNSPIYCPAGREVDREQVQAGFVNAYTSIGPRNKKRVPLVLEEKATSETVGYIIVQPGRTQGAEKTLTLYIYDIAVDPETAKKGLSRFLCGGGEQLLARMGGGVFYGDISADNQLAVGAQKGLGFQVDSIRWGFKVS